MYWFLTLAVKLETTHKPTKPLKNQPNTSQTTHKPAKYRTNHPKISQLLPENQLLMLPKTLATMQNVLNLQPFYSILSTFSSEDQSQVGIEGKWREII